MGRKAKPRTRPDDLTITDVEKAIKIPTAQWEGNCYSIACAIIESGLVKGRAVYGHYYGPVAKTGYWKDRRHHPFQRHGWIELPDGRILDPTRWSFENRTPYLHICDPLSDVHVCRTCDHVEDEHKSGFLRECAVENCGCPDFERKEREYDEGGNLLMKAMENPPPPFTFKDLKVELAVKPSVYNQVIDLLGNPPHVTKPMCFWLANLSLATLGDLAKDVYQALVKAGMDALIPIDNRRAVLGED